MIRNPVFESSMTRRMRSYRAPLLLTLYCAFLLVVSGGALVMLQKADLSLGNLRMGLETYVYLVVMQFALIVLVAPALTAGSIAGERERQTLDLLLCTRVSALGIVLGKLFSSVCFLALLVASSLPVMSVTLFFGGVAFGDMLAALLFLLVTAAACCAVGLFCSAVFKRTVTATVVAYLIVFAIGAGTLLLPLLFQYGQLSEAANNAASLASGVAVRSAYVQPASGGAPTIWQSIAGVPKLLIANPGVALVSLLISQTGLLQNTLGSLMGYRGNQAFSVLQVVGSLAGLNMGFMALCSAFLTGLAVLFVKPAGRKAKKKKK